MKIQLKVSVQEAQRKLSRIANTPGTSNFASGLAEYWKTIEVVENGNTITRPTVMAFCWLYCWAEDDSPAHQTGAELAAEVWNNIVNISRYSIKNRTLFNQMAHEYRYLKEEQQQYIDNIDNLLPDV
ncbi:hypothetical protein FACS189476_12290 [Spirochaetia bacterium]|nr:hypothetical protein FACS189476_12290 [Spirochaetia bacterium]